MKPSEIQARIALVELFVLTNCIVNAIRAEVRAIDPSLPLDDVVVLRDAVDSHIANPRLVAMTFNGFAVTASALDAERNAARFTEDGGSGVVLRFGMFYSPDSDHIITGGGDDGVNAAKGGNDWIQAGLGRDIVYAISGDPAHSKLIEGGAGDDVLTGGPGNDEIYANVRIDLAAAILAA